MRRFTTNFGAITLVIVLLLVVAALPYRERARLFIFPSAPYAYALGMKYLTPSTYNIVEAEYFFMRAAHIDPNYPYVHHQLARVYFLTGRYPQALTEVNTEIAHDQGKTGSSSYYLRGLIEGYLNDYASAVRDYKEFVVLEPSRWEGRVDYAWVLIKTGNFTEAARVVDTGLATDPNNPWLLSVRTTILFEAGDLPHALATARRAQTAVNGITESQWMTAYPGNAPEAAVIGIKTLRDAANANLQKIEAAAAAKGIW